MSHINDDILSIANTGHINDGLYNYFGGNASIIDPDATLAFLFAKDQSLIDQVSGLELDFVRGSEGSYYDGTGILQIVSDDVARFDHEPDTRNPLGLLLEEPRTNIMVESESISAPGWGVPFNATITDNATLAPDGNMTMDELVAIDVGGQNAVRIHQDVNPVSGAHTVTCFFKPGGVEHCAIGSANFDPSGNGNTFFDLIGDGAIAVPDPNHSNISIKRVANGSYKCSITFTTTSDLFGSIRFWMDAGNYDFIVPLDGVASLFMWGFQMESGAFGSSYIRNPTAAPVLRNSDFCSTGDMSWYNLLAGTMYSKSSTFGFSNVQKQTVCAIGQAGNTSLNLMRHEYILQAARYTVASPSPSALLDHATVVPTIGQRKMASVSQQDDFEFFMDSARSGTGDQSGNVPDAPVILRLGADLNSIWFLNGHVSEFGFAGVRKSNAFLESLTAPS